MTIASINSLVWFTLPFTGTISFEMESVFQDLQNTGEATIWLLTRPNIAIPTTAGPISWEYPIYLEGKNLNMKHPLFCMPNPIPT